ncbi:MAG: hypothetical protein HRT44_03195 [Bdellovibrionales bacterium]|nr:hypothetical protein [Bdellovibrionales bacterium]NQZ18252.1 hypothetical protein [Bdellovibrionales bacterium]
MHSQLFNVLEQAEKLKVPVLIDCAYFGTVSDFSIDLNHPAIEAVCFSLTKGTALGDIRSGMRLCREEDEGPISQQNRFNHTVLAAAKIGLYMMKRFGPDYIPEKYKPLQIEVCERAGIEPQKCIHLAHGGSDWDDFKIDLLFNRLGIRELIKAKRKGEI